MYIKYVFLGLIAFGFCCLNPTQLGTPTPESVYKFSFAASQPEVYTALNATVKDFQMSEWLAVEKSVRDNNREVEDNIRKLNADLQTRNEQLQQLASSRNVAQIKANLEALKKAKAEMGRITEERLKTINYQGLYLVVCSGISSRTALPTLQKAVQDKLAPDAVKTLNGLFIESMTELHDNQVEYDYVRERVSGMLERINAYFWKMDAGDGRKRDNYACDFWRKKNDGILS